MNRLAVERSDGKVYPSMIAAARDLRPAPQWVLEKWAQRISRACLGARSVLGFQWKRRPDLDEVREAVVVGQSPEQEARQ